MRLIDLDEFLRQNCVDRMDGKSCEECKHHVLEVSCERLMELPAIAPKTGYIEFAEWVAKEVMREDFGDGFFAEVACRKLYRLGIITMDGEKWKLEREEDE